MVKLQYMYIAINQVIAKLKLTRNERLIINYLQSGTKFPSEMNI